MPMRDMYSPRSPIARTTGGRCWSSCRPIWRSEGIHMMTTQVVCPRASLRHWKVRLQPGLACTAITVSVAYAADTPLHPPSLADVFSIEGLGAVAIDPSGRRVVFEREPRYRDR